MNVILFVIYISASGQSSITTVPMSDMGTCGTVQTGLIAKDWKKGASVNNSDPSKVAFPGQIFSKCTLIR